MLTEDRREVIEYLRKQIVGPAEGKNEILPKEDRPSARYLMGTLYPLELDTDEAQKDEELFEGGGEGSDDDGGDSPVSMAYQYMPSSFGISFYVTSKQINCKISGARYLKASRLDYVNDIQGDKIIIKDGGPCWGRSSIFESTRPEEVILKVPTERGGGGYKEVLYGQAKLHHFWRKKRGGYLVTVTLINTLVSGGKHDDDSCLYQLNLECQAIDGVIREYPFVDKLQWDDEEEDLAVVYRHRRSYAVGHGCSASWVETDNSLAASVRAEFLPEVEVPDLTAKLDNLNQQSLKALSLQFLANPNTDILELKAALECFVGEYSAWIKELPSHHQDLTPHDERAKERILSKIKTAEQRMLAGIRTLTESPESYVRTSFMLANYAMLMQMVHSGGDYSGSVKIRNEFTYDRPDYMSENYEEIRWRPFQLAFFLLSLESIVNEGSSDRELVDLIWFPTGGGKTEAYLALAALELFHRRFIYGESGCGTAILKRYTLRLLTSQQFQRAATLICACELLLRERQQGDFRDYLKDFPGSFSLGLWVGGEVTPNRYTDTGENKGAKELFEKLLDQDQPENPFQLTRCPWCGTRIVPKKISSNQSDYGVIAKATSFKFFCPTDSCPFHDKIPVTVVDEDIFLHPPSFIVGTIDKFARITWDDRTSALFGSREDSLPPSLIIQDELHLISGPLGTIAGIYESAIDTIIKANGGKPKVVAATATIRRAADQCRKLYGKKVAVFPPQGLSADDSYFAKLDTTQPGRLYVGVMAPAHRPVTSLVHVTAALAQAPIETNISEAAKSGFWTQIIFHNSRRELGKTISLARDDIPARVKVISRDQSKMRSPENVVELSANVSGKAIPEILERLNSGPKRNDVIDILPCTNMLSVGVDVKRLGLMVINGQPKTTAEYIQASSRVGRDTRVIPGIVITLYSPTKPRDRSHYEKFVSYHQALYRSVEPTSVTPYAMPARDRAIHASLVALMRLSGNLPRNEDARYFDPSSPKVLRLTNMLKQRIEAADPFMSKETIDHLDRLIQQWCDRITEAQRQGRPLVYNNQSAGRQFSTLLKHFGDTDNDAWATLNSMRHVDRECLIYVRGS